ncbi:hypothetical protein L6164_007682 [Bauhinia variegata]|uniref:Uncharacterized protein n=1 Tax=Bauhinia variegata TaxID=167791 RepID=A0ACB9PH51_BAUVA|nr:hypothetical protein L6164_007682 [Bauhinia variegata]
MAARINRRDPQRLELIPDLKKRRAAFSKRRSGLYKRAYELSIMCGIDIALVMFSPTDKVYSFGCPNLICLMDRYRVQPPFPMNHPQHIIENHCNPSLLVLNERLNILKEQSDAEEQRGKELDQVEKACREHNWMEGPIDQMTESKRQRFVDALVGLKKKVQEAQRLKIQSSNAESHAGFFSGSCSSHPPHLFSGEGSSSSGPARAFAGGSSSNRGAQAQHPPLPSGVFQPPVAHQNPLLQNLAFNENAIGMVPTPRSQDNVGDGHGRWHF